MKTLALHDDAGRITMICTVTDNTAALPMYAQAVEVGPDISAARWYVADGQCLQRPDNPAVLTGLALESLPVPCDIMINDQTYPCSDPTAELDLSAGQYSIRVRAFPYLDANFEVTV